MEPDDEALSTSTVCVLAAVGAVFLTSLVLLFSKRKPLSAPKEAGRGRASLNEVKEATRKPAARAEEAELAASPAKPGISLKQLLKDKKAGKARLVGGPASADKATHHPLYVNTLKGHQDAVTGLAFSRKGGLIATACEDRAVRLFDLDDGADKHINFRRKNLSVTPVDVAFGLGPAEVVVLTKGSLDAAALSCHDMQSGAKLSEGPRWEVGDIHGGEAGLCVHAGTSVHDQRVVLSASRKTDLQLASAADGKLLGRADSNGLQNYGAALSSNGKFFAAATFTADVKVYELKSARTGDMLGVSKVMDLKGHRGQVLCLAFSPDSTKMVTASKDGTWCVWNIAVRYGQQEDPKCLLSRHQEGLSEGMFYRHLAFGPNNLICAAFGRDLHFLDAQHGGTLEHVEEAHEEDITCLEWAPTQHSLSGRQVYMLATGSEDRKVRLWRAPVV